MSNDTDPTDDVLVAAIENVAKNWGVDPIYAEPFVNLDGSVNCVLDLFFYASTEMAPLLTALQCHFSSYESRIKLISYIIESKITICSEIDLLETLNKYFSSYFHWKKS